MYEQLRLEDVLGTLHVGPDEICGCVPPATVEAKAEILRLRAAGFGHSEIARTLNARAIPTPTGRGQWWPDTVKRHVNPGPWRAYIRRYRSTHPQR